MQGRSKSEQFLIRDTLQEIDSLEVDCNFRTDRPYGRGGTLLQDNEVLSLQEKGKQVDCW